MQQRFLESEHATADPVPDVYWPTLFPNPHDVHILIVTDSGGSFGEGSFGMRDLVETLRTPPGRPFPVITAYDGHRVHGPDAQPGRS
ncbi:MAG TPA: hypothetical protein VHF24_12720 [Acidimicrobiales bacterium]|nr:hypothetical protein [Acidimicrobiales bacterium]